MIMIRAIIRPEKVSAVLDGLLEAGYPAVTKVNVVGRGKQRGIKVGDVTYDELPKEMLLVVVPDQDKEFALKAIMDNAKSSDKGSFGDGKVFISKVSEVYTVSTGQEETDPLSVEELKEV
jgi:nitrogen regulatory protein PII 1